MNKILVIVLIIMMNINLIAQNNHNNIEIIKTENNKDNTEIPFKLINSVVPLILVPVYINGKGPYDFILDTGASKTIISVELAKELEIKGDKRAKGVGAGGEIKVMLGELDTFGIDTAQIEKLEVAISTPEELERVIGKKVNGIVGYNYFKHYRMTIDYPKGIMILEFSQK